MDSWIATGTVDTTSTSTTLVATTAIFTNGMVGLTVYNETDDEYAIITDYTSTTTLTLDTTIGDTWDGDTIYVLGQEFVLGGDATDLYGIEAVGVKYDSEARYYYITGEIRPKFDLFQNGGEVWNSSSPQVYVTTAVVGSSSYNAIGILPGFTTNQKISEAIEVTYVAKPAEMSGASDTMRMPVDNVVIYGATAAGFRQKQQYKEANEWEQKYMRARREFKSRFRPSGLGFVAKPRMPRSFYDTFNRIR